MLDSLLNDSGGREILSKKELGKSEVGVELENDSLHGYYAFPSAERASQFLEEATIRFATEVNEMTVGNIFENSTLTQRFLEGIGKILSYFPGKKSGLTDEQFEAEVKKQFNQYDMRRYGMSLADATDIMIDKEQQRNFESKFGISYNEYIMRMAGGEMMGDSMKNGRWTSID